MNNTQLQKVNVYETSNYDQFNFLTYNRDIIECRLNGLMESIKEHGFLLPILVDNNMNIIDGQHRFMAAKKLGYAIKYIKFPIPSDKVPFLVSSVNRLSKNWSLEDHLNMWKDLNKENYVWLYNVLKDYNIKYNVICLYLGNGRWSVPFKKGDFIIKGNKRTLLIERIKDHNEIINYSSYFTKLPTSFHKNIFRIVCSPTYKHNRMMLKLRESAGELLNCSTALNFAIQMEKLYNNNERTKTIFTKA